MSLTSRPAPNRNSARRVRIVLDYDVVANARLELLAERFVAPVDVRRVVDGRLGRVDEARGGDADSDSVAA
jgi:hypothetical protein